MQWLTRERREALMLKQCEACGRYFDHESDVLCERCNKKRQPKHTPEVKRICSCGAEFAPFDHDDYTCPECKKVDFEQMTDHEKDYVYRKVRDFLYANPLTLKLKVSERFGVPLKTIDEWIHHGKMEQIDEVELRDAPEGYCKYCGVRVHSGKICKPCEKRLSEKLESHTSAMQRMSKEKGRKLKR